MDTIAYLLALLYLSELLARIESKVLMRFTASMLYQVHEDNLWSLMKKPLGVVAVFITYRMRGIR